MTAAANHFLVIDQADHPGETVRCSYCARIVKRVVVLPLADRTDLEERIRAGDGEEFWRGLCAYCVLAMAKALARAEVQPA